MSRAYPRSTGLTPKILSAGRAAIWLRSRGSRLGRANGLDYILGIGAERRHCVAMSKVWKPARRPSLRGRAARRQALVRVQGTPPMGAQSSEPGRADHRARRSGRGRGPDTASSSTRIRSERNCSPAHTRMSIAGAARGRKPYQVLQKTHDLAADRTSCSKATANQFRLFLHAGAYSLMWGSSARRCQSVQRRALPSSTRCASASSRSPPASSR